MANTPPLISIIIPTFNSENYLFETLLSVQIQTFTFWQCIIVDDGSTDGTYNIANSFLIDKRFSFVVRNRLPKGANTCRNIGASLSNGHYLMFLDSDDVLSQYCVEKRSLALVNKNLDLGIFNVAILNDNTIINRKLTGVGDSFLKMFLRHNLPWHTTAGVIKKEYFFEINGFDESFQRLQDPDFYTNALIFKQINFHYFYDHEPDTFYRHQFNIKIKKKDFYIKVVISFYQYIDKYASLIKSSKKLSILDKNDLVLTLKKLYIKTIFKYFLDKNFANNELYSMFRRLGTKQGFINSSESLLLIFIYQINQFKITFNISKNLYFRFFIRKYS